MTQPRLALAAAVLVLVLAAGCSSDDDPAAAPATSSTTSSTSPVLTPTAPPEMIVDGKRYPLTFATCAQKLWDDRVDEWNALVQAGKSGDTDQAGYFKAKGWPASFAATLDAPTTRTACPA
jgi:ABC-type Fe3+-hydroxamate transport system substrate-binding protein